MQCCCRRQAELEARLIEEETERLVSEAVEGRVKEVMASQAVQQSLQERLVRERKLLEEQVLQTCIVTECELYTPCECWNNASARSRGKA